jgi:hypothetical protein
MYFLVIATRVSSEICKGASASTTGVTGVAGITGIARIAGVARI